MRNNLGIYLKYILHNIKYLDLDIRLPEPIISHLDINILLHNWYYQLLRHGYFPTLLIIYFSYTNGIIIFLGTASYTQLVLSIT